MATAKAKEPEQVPATQPQGGSVSILQDYKGPMGTENIENEDVTIPRLKIGQAISDEVKDGSVKEGALYLNVTSESIWAPGDAPLPAQIVAQSKEYILWRPRQDEGGGILARAKPVRDDKGHVRYQWDKPNETFEVKIGGKIKAIWKTGEFIDQDGLGDWGSEIPDDKDSGIAATSHHNYLVMLPSIGGVIAAISMSRSGVKVAKNLNAALKMGNPKIPICLRKFNFTTVDDVGGNGDKFKNWAFKPNGNLITTDGKLIDGKDEEIASLGMKYFKEFLEGGYTVDQSDAKTADNAAGDKEVPF